MSALPAIPAMPCQPPGVPPPDRAISTASHQLTQSLAGRPDGGVDGVGVAGTEPHHSLQEGRGATEDKRGWVVVPVLGHVLKQVHRHVLRHVLGRHVPEHMLEHMPGQVLRHLPEYVSRHVPKHMLNPMAHAVLMT